MRTSFVFSHISRKRASWRSCLRRSCCMHASRSKGAITVGRNPSPSPSQSLGPSALIDAFPWPLSRAALCMCLFACPNKVSPTTNPLLPISGSRLYETISHDVSILHNLLSPTLGIYPHPSIPCFRPCVAPSGTIAPHSKFSPTIQSRDLPRFEQIMALGRTSPSQPQSVSSRDAFYLPLP